MRRALLPSKPFVRAAQRLQKRHLQVTSHLEAALTLLEADAFDPRLRTHKLKGKLKDLWACSAGYDLRIVFKFVRYEGSEAILLQSVGTHEEVY